MPNAGTPRIWLRRLLAPLLNADGGVWVLEELASAKDGEHSVGVAYHRNGRVGQVSNCQLGVFLAYASSRGQALVDGRLYLPPIWADDAKCRRAVGVPESVTYQPKQDLWLALLRTARARGHLRSQWVTGAPEPAQTEAHRKGLDVEGWQYLLAVPASTVVFAPQPVGKLPFFAWRGQPSRPRWLTPEARPKMVQALAARLPRAASHTAMVADGTHRPAAWWYAFIPVWECNVGEPGRARWLVLHRNRDRRMFTVYLSNALATTALETLLRVSVAHRCIKTAIKRQQAAIGLNEYEVRSWRSWYHHMALSLLAGAFLLQQAREKPVAPVALAADEPWA